MDQWGVVDIETAWGPVEDDMGTLRIEMSGSFDRAAREFSADDGGHADAISQAIEWLAATALPRAIEQDHALASDGQKPKKPFGRGRHEG